MLAAIGVASIDELFEDIPEALRLGRPLELPTESPRRRSTTASRRSRPETPTPRWRRALGAGMYDHYVPAVVDAITSRSEFLTPTRPISPRSRREGSR